MNFFYGSLSKSQTKEPAKMSPLIASSMPRSCEESRKMSLLIESSRTINDNKSEKIKRKLPR